MKNKDFIYGLVAGAISVVFFNTVLPTIDSVGVWVQNIFGQKSYKIQKKVEEMEVPQKAQPVNAVGFQVPEEQEELEDE